MRFISSDLLNPMLVRDLRQGLRSSRFTSIFLVLQGCLAFFVAMGLLADPGSDMSGSLVQALAFAVVFFYILVLPMTATFALSQEFRENRIDLLKLTQMSARSLVWGKWWSLFVQGLLVVISLLPYVILTYFLGGVDVGILLEGLGFILAISALLVGACVAFSCFNSMVFRVMLVIALIWLVGISMGGFGGRGPGLYGFGNISGGEVGVVAALFLTIGVPTLWLLMEYGAYRLAPSSENHDTPQRLILLGMVAVGGVAIIFDLYKPGTFLNAFIHSFFFLGSFLAGWVLMFATATDPSPYPDAYRPFARFGAPGRFIGRIFLYPGWPSSAPFVMLASAFFAMLAVAMASRRGGTMLDYNEFGSFMLLPPAILFPQMLGWLLLGRTRHGPGTRYFVAFGFCLLVWMFSRILSSVLEKDWILSISALIPTDAWYLITIHEAAGTTQESIIWILGIGSSLATMIVVSIRTLKHWKKFTELELLAANLAVERPNTTLPIGTVRPSPAVEPTLGK